MPLASLTKAAGHYTIVDFSTKAIQAISILILAKTFSKTDFGQFSILFSVLQLASVLVIGGAVESAVPILARKDAEIDELMRQALEKSYSIVRFRMVILIPIAVATATLLALTSSSLVISASWGWLVVYSLAGIASGCANTYIGVLTCAGDHHKSIYFRANLIIGQSIVGVALAMFLGSPNYYGLSILMIPLLLMRSAILRNYQNLIKNLSKYQVGAFDYFFINAVINWLPWYGLTLMVGMVLGRESAAEYSLIMNITSVLLIAAGGFSQAFISEQIRSSHLTIGGKIGSVIALQTIILSIIAGLLIFCYRILLNLNFINDGYDHLQERLSVSLLSIVVSSSYFITVAAYSLREKGLTLLNISYCSIFIAIIAGCISYIIDETYFPYVVFSSFFVVRGFLVSYMAGYSWSSVVKDKQRILIISILFVATLVVGIVITS
jgi:O-antigen/teichoic acid export membrane protein